MVQEELAGSEEAGAELEARKERPDHHTQKGGLNSGRRESQAHPYVPICKYRDIREQERVGRFFSSSFLPPMRRLDVDKPGCGYLSEEQEESTLTQAIRLTFRALLLHLEERVERRNRRAGLK